MVLRPLEPEGRIQPKSPANRLNNCKYTQKNPYIYTLEFIDKTPGNKQTNKQTLVCNQMNQSFFRILLQQRGLLASVHSREWLLVKQNPAPQQMLV